MEKRKSERVQFFQLGKGKDIQPIWVFRQTFPGAILGLLLDVTPNGAQVLTHKPDELAGNSFRLIVHLSEIPGEETLKVDVRCAWSRLEGTLYFCNGLDFEEQISLQPVIAARDSGRSWLRCELLPL